MAKDPPETVEVLSERVNDLIQFIDRAEKWGFELRMGEAQNLMNEMLDTYFGELGDELVGVGASNG